MGRMLHFGKLLPAQEYFCTSSFLLILNSGPTMSLELSDVKRLSTLVQIELTDQQSAQTLDKLNGIFALVEQLRAVDTSGIEPLNHPIATLLPNLSLRLRDDTVSEPNRRDDYQQVAPATQDGLYLVPKVIE
jgi:aspartyl-tRNA(Asn)/glutamyl-tRNA(Gln) amidotransferase subunit C